VFIFSGTRLRAIRERSQLTREQLASATRLSFHSIFAYENGFRRPSRASLLRLSAALGVTPRDLVDEDPDFAKPKAAAR
jgi:transcriptional regulator with XRE-family HTH domain